MEKYSERQSHSETRDEDEDRRRQEELANDELRKALPPQ